MSLKKKGISAERELVHLLQDAGCAAIRVAGSGSTKTPSADIISGNGQRVFAIECKTSKSDSRYISKEQITGFLAFARQFGAEPWIAVKFFRLKWQFILVEDLVETNAHFCVSKTLVAQRGLTLDEFLEKKKDL